MILLLVLLALICAAFGAFTPARWMLIVALIIFLIGIFGGFD